MKITHLWNSYWFKPTPYFDLAVIRIILVSLQVFLLLSSGFDLIAYANTLPTEIYDPVYVLRLLLLDFDGSTRPSPELVNGVFWTALISGAGAVLGLATNGSLLVFTICNLIITGYIYSFGDFHHPEAIMMVALAALALAPTGRVLSLDSILRRHFLGKGIEVPLLQASGMHAGWPIKFLQWFFPLMYISAVVGKLGRSGIEWANGFTLQAIMIQEYYRNGSSLALLLSRQHELLHLAQYGVLIFQATFFLIVPFARLRWIYLPIGLAFHLGIYFTLRAPFPQWIALYAIYIPWAAVFAYAARHTVLGDSNTNHSIATRP